VESLSVDGRAALAKRCKLDNDELADLLIETRRHVPFVQANLLATTGDDAAEIARWRDRLQAAGVWANDPVPLYPYPASPEYRALFGAPDDAAWERAHRHYLAAFERFSDIQDQRPLALETLEARP
jgi:anaerobic magnesium-protoporphyrin IX monomethyl ester cyclase